MATPVLEAQVKEDDISIAEVPWSQSIFTDQTRDAVRTPALVQPSLPQVQHLGEQVKGEVGEHECHTCVRWTDEKGFVHTWVCFLPQEELSRPLPPCPSLQVRGSRRNHDYLMPAWQLS